MKMTFLKDRRLRIGVQALFIYTWLSNLAGTDSFLTVYLLCALTGVLCLWDNGQNPNHPALWVRVLAWILSGLFGLATVLANYPLFEPVTALISLFNGGCALLGGFFIANNILLCAIRRLPLKPEPRQPLRERTGAAPVFFLFSGAVAAVFLLYLFTTGYPVYLAHDSIVSLDQIREGVYSNHHPYWYTRFIELCMDLGYLFTTDINVAAAVYSTIQSLILAVCFGYALVTLYQAGIPLWCIGAVFGMYALLPYNITYSITMWKDTLFGGCSLAVVTALYRILKGIGKCRWLNYGVFALSGVGFCLVRNNGLPVFLVWAAFMVIFLGRKHWKLLVICLLVLIIAWFMTGPMLDMLDVAGTEMVEILAVPFQQIARLIANDCPIADSDMEILKEIFWIDRVKELYTPYIVDPIKFEAMRPDGEAYIKENMGQFLSLWLRLGLQYPGEYVKAWVEETKGYWNGGYYYWIYIRGTYPEISGIGPFRPDNLGKDLFDALFRYTEKPVILEPLYAIGMQVWTIISCCFVCFARKRKEFLTAIPMLVLAAVLWVMTPVYAEFRYAYPLFVTCPLILLTTIFPGPAEKGSVEV